MDECEESIYIFFWTKKALPKSETSSAFYITHIEAQLQYLSAITVSSFTPTSQYRKDINKLGQVHWRVTKSGTGALWEGAGFSLEKRRLWGHLRAVPVPMRRMLPWQSQVCCGSASETKGVCWNKKDAVTIRKSSLLTDSWAGYQGFWVLNYYTKIKIE